MTDSEVRKARLEKRLTHKKINLLGWMMEGEQIESGYCGKGMMDSCLAFKYDCQRSAVKAMISAINDNDKEDRDTVHEALMGYQIDLLETGVVLYFPELKIVV